MRVRLLPYQIDQIVDKSRRNLHENILGVNILDRHVQPIQKGVYFVDVRDPVGRLLVSKNTPALCLYDTGEIFCLHDKRIPLTEARIVHEFLHRAARRKRFFRYVSGIDIHPKHTFRNECITEYLTMRIIGREYYEEINPANRYLPFLHEIEELERHRGIEALTKAYLAGNRRLFCIPKKRIIFSQLKENVRANFFSEEALTIHIMEKGPAYYDAE
ncbi:MAG: hypothetical protein IJU25_06655 [Lachnospiraceae bacterium]|nr:hypothetical protein [Lachnospiraceae bacterium]